MFDTDIAIIGAGPVGLSLAEYLAQRGIHVVIFEREEAVGLEWRASTFHAATLEMLDEIDVADHLVSNGNVAQIEQHRAPDVGVIAEFDYGMLADITKFPFRLQCPQQTLVARLQERLRARDEVDLRLGQELLGFSQDQHGITGTARINGSTDTFRAKVLIGADGGTSTVRKSMGIAFEGVTYEDRFLQLSTAFDVYQVLPDVRNANYVYDPDDNMQLLHLPDAWKVTIPIKASENETDATDPQAAARRLQRILGTDADIPLQGTKIYKVHQRVAQRFYDGGRVALCGDAAHVNSPVGGMGLNSGIHDVFELGPRIERILATDASTGPDVCERELAEYSATRRRIAVDFVQKMTHANTQNLAESKPDRRKEIFDDLRATASNSARARERVHASSMLAMLTSNPAG